MQRYYATRHGSAEAGLARGHVRGDYSPKEELWLRDIRRKRQNQSSI